nr:hypothetical protein [uncultured bacterium]
MIEDNGPDEAARETIEQQDKAEEIKANFLRAVEMLRSDGKDFQLAETFCSGINLGLAETELGSGLTAEKIEELTEKAKFIISQHDLSER